VKLTASILFVLALNTAYGQNASFPRLEPDTKAIEFYRLGRRNNGYSWADLAQISLWASGDSSAAGLEKIRGAVLAVSSSANLPSSKREKAEFIQTFLHGNILKSYSVYQSRVDTIFTNGRFNCVSSAVLYMILCEAAGIETSGVITKDHAFVTVHINGEDIDVETTNPYGFDPGSKKEFHDQFGTATGYAYVPARNSRDRRTISKIELVSLIMNNRINEYERQNNIAQAVPIALDAAALLLGELSAVNYAGNSGNSLLEAPQDVLMDRLINYGAWLLKANREEDCLRWAQAASLKYPHDRRWQELAMAAANNRLIRFTRENKLTDARNFLESRRSVLAAADYAQLDSVLIDAELLKSANQIRTSAEGDAVVSAVEQARGKISEKRALELRTFAIQKTAAILYAAPAKDWRAAIRYLEKYLALFGANRDLEQALRTCRSNLAADYHNRFAVEWNKKNFIEAGRILNEGLEEFPNDRTLLSDREAVNKMTH
jgi:hypothetical protein